jgi:hypothetical protein
MSAEGLSALVFVGLVIDHPTATVTSCDVIVFYARARLHRHQFDAS